MTIEELTTLEKLNNAFYDCMKASYWKESTQRYNANLLMMNTELQNDLCSGNYKVSKTVDFTINERGKKRDINSPIMRDRIVQKILCQQILIPYLTKPLIYDNYASLKNRGTSFARKRINIMLRKFLREYDSGYILQVDIKSYFASIDHNILKDMVHKRICEPKEIMGLIDYIIDTSSTTDKGLNLGAEAPQIFAIYYLSELDNYIKSVKGVKYYGRYMDDMFVFSPDKNELKVLLREIETQLKKVKLTVNEHKTHITPLRHGFTFMQIKYNIVGKKIIKRPTRPKIVRERRRLKKYKKKYDDGEMLLLDIKNSYKSWRNGFLKDCPQGRRSIYQMDKLYNSLFPNGIYKKQSREQLINEIFKDKEVRKHIDLDF